MTEEKLKPKKSPVKFLIGIILILVVSLLYTTDTISVVSKKGLICFTYNNALYEDVKSREVDNQ